jgi:hypothetical protein
VSSSRANIFGIQDDNEAVTAPGGPGPDTTAPTTMAAQQDGRNHDERWLLTPFPTRVATEVLHLVGFAPCPVLVAPAAPSIRATPYAAPHDE